MEWEVEYVALEMDGPNGMTHGYLLVAERDGPFRRSVRLVRAVGIVGALRDTLRAAGEARRPGRLHVNPTKLATALSALQLPLGVPVVGATDTPLASALMDTVLHALRAGTPKGGHRCIFIASGFSLFAGHAEPLWIMDLVVDEALAGKMAARLEPAESVTFAAVPSDRSEPSSSLVVFLHGRHQALGPFFEGVVGPQFAATLGSTPDLVIRVWSKPRKDPPALVKSVRLAHRAPGERTQRARVFDGPRAGWPNPALTLVEFANATGCLPDLDDPIAQEALEAVATVWRATVLADFLGQTDSYDVMMASEVRPFADHLVRVKRQRYPTDPRVFEVIQVSPTGDLRCMGRVGARDAADGIHGPLTVAPRHTDIDSVEHHLPVCAAREHPVRNEAVEVDAF